ncbi:hypothetical protein [Paenarthrobacter sp. PH39-S1]|uniref:hypothetical protein n=1 Tax=Paenarthrobacter sp. PH39-S1 TaxID=3046204 RepID=UPI0024BBB375|nr:hypothetical protein [Paenarthrobacter sp. PH39-S1]MDJ0356889.1 hypothetical protein [Paenarthrobacter sp. PH39-S1]
MEGLHALNRGRRFGGFAPVIAAYLVQQAGRPVARGNYLAVVGLNSLAALAADLKLRGIR